MKTVRRAYAVSDIFKDVRRVIVDEWGAVFYPDDAWHSYPRSTDRLVFLPGELPYKDWYDGWWTTNWRDCPDWVWCYGFKKPKIPSSFTIIRKIGA